MGANKMESNELKLITLQNENEQLHEMKTENNIENELINDKNAKIIALQIEINRINKELDEENAKECESAKRFKEMKAMYNEMLIKNKQLCKDQKMIQNESDKMSVAYKRLLIEFDELDREYTEYKNCQKNELKLQNQKKMKRILTPKQSENVTMKIETKILEQELFDEQQRTKDLNQMIDELKIQNSILLTDMNKLKAFDDEGMNSNILEMQSLQIKNDKLSKKIKIQQKKIEMYK